METFQVQNPRRKFNSVFRKSKANNFKISYSSFAIPRAKIETTEDGGRTVMQYPGTSHDALPKRLVSHRQLSPVSNPNPFLVTALALQASLLSDNTKIIILRYVLMSEQKKITQSSEII